jgi:DNA mismatch repair protein MutL
MTNMSTSITRRRPIQQLSASVINKIAAGEVIERPASVVKELLENSVDAGATQVEVSLENGGLELIRITDNGSGIPEDQLMLAVTSHATSKIEDADDLFSVGTFGFRGEALASITEVSQATIRSRTPDSDCGFELVVNGGNHDPIEPCGCPVGTTIEVRQLFYNTPVRQKFLKTAQTERGHIAEAFTRVALANPQVQMTLLNNGKVLHQLAATESWSERIKAFFGPEIGDNLIPISNQDESVSVSGFVVDPAVSRSNNRMQYLFLNERYIRDRSLQHALSEAYRGLLMVGRYPICFLRMQMPFEMVDVNVHPAKLEVRFQNGGTVYRQLLGTLRNKFLTTDLTAKGQLARRTPAPEEPTLELKPSVTEQQDRIAFNVDSDQRDWTSASRQPLGLNVTGERDFQPFPPLSPLKPAATAPGPSSRVTSVSMPSADAEPITFPADYDPFSQPMPATATAGSDVDSSPALPVPAAQQRQRPFAIQVHNTYLVQETAEGMIIIDQHALHERIIYEQIREKILAGKLESQKMLVPEPVTLPPAEAAAVLEQTELLKNVGIEVEPFGGDTVLVSSYPTMLARQNPAEVLKGVVDKLMGEAKNLDQRDLVDELLHMISCKAAIKAGDPLTPEEITSLLEQRELCQDGHHCPHGRPTSLTFSREQLDKKFKRI